MSGETSQDTDSGAQVVVTPGEPVAHTDVEDGVSVGQHAEPENNESSEGNQTPPPVDDLENPPPEPPPKQRLEDIYAKAKTGRSAEMDEDVSSMTEQGKLEHLQRLEAEAGGRPDPFAEDPNAPPPDDSTAGEPPVTPTQTPDVPPPPAATPQVATQNPSEGIDAASETTTITVYGMREEVPTADVNAAGGIDAFQKSRAADIKLERAATYEASLRQYESQLSERAANLEQRGTQTPAQDGTGLTESSPTDAQGDTADIDALSGILTDAVYGGDREETQKQFASVLGSVRADAIRTVQAQAQQSAPSGPTAEQQAAELRSKQEANAVFRDEFPELDTQVLRDATFAMVKQVAADPMMINRPLSEITREACSRVRSDVFPNAGPKDPVVTPVTQTANPLISETGNQTPPVDLGTRLDLKRRTVVSPQNEAHGRVVEPPANEQSFPSNSDFVAQLKKVRGQP